jgi:hypothetical protein
MHDGDPPFVQNTTDPIKDLVRNIGHALRARLAGTHYNRMASCAG